jgi:phage/plasmid-like protein (TIGR03299 family)
MQITDFVNKPWGDNGIQVNTACMQEAMRVADLDWEVEKTPAYMIAPGGHTGVEQYKRVKGEYFIRRKDNQDVVLGRCGSRWTPLQNTKAFGFFQQFLDEQQARLHTVGTIDGGKKVWVLAQMNGEAHHITPTGDKVNKFILLVNSHDAKTSVIVGFIPIRFSCTNMLSMLARDGSSQIIRIRHTSSVADQVEQLAPMMLKYQEVFDDQVELYRMLANVKFDMSELHEYVKEVFKITPPEGQTELTSRAAKKLGTLTNYCLNGIGQDDPFSKGTWWAAYNGVTQYLNYEYGRSTNSRLNALWFGEGQRTSQRALEAAARFAKIEELLTQGV